MGQRKQYTAAFKAKVALEAIKDSGRSRNWSHCWQVEARCEPVARTSGVELDCAAHPRNGYTCRQRPCVPGFELPKHGDRTCWASTSGFDCGARSRPADRLCQRRQSTDRPLHGASTRVCREGRNRSERLTSWIPSRRTCPPTSTFTSLWITTVHTRPQSSGIGLRNDPAFTSTSPYLGLAADEVGRSAPVGIAQPSQSTNLEGIVRARRQIGDGPLL